MKVDGGGSLMQIHPDVQFYDYTKVLNYLDHDLNNYHITFSDSGKKGPGPISSNEKKVLMLPLCLRISCPNFTLDGSESHRR